MKKFLHVGCGPKTKLQTTPVFASEEWEEIRLDIDENCNPDIIAALPDLSDIETSSYDAIFSSHNIEHLFPHEVDIALLEFNRVLKDDGYLLITCPDLKSVAKHVAEDKLLDVLYESPAGPIAALDIIYGHRLSLQKGNHYMAHKSGFTRTVLMGLFNNAGFNAVTGAERQNLFDLWCIGSKDEKADQKIIEQVLRSHLGLVDEVKVF
tara:strand:+ start:2331 stop:2954 length:624 start_codon:yes stop_codon:yes gene_type:complete